MSTAEALAAMLIGALVTGLIWIIVASNQAADRREEACRNRGGILVDRTCIRLEGIIKDQP